MEITLFTKNSLQEFILSDQFKELENLPISFHRAVSQIHNPRADEKDILLAVQLDGNKTAGYLGVFPDYIYHKGEGEKIGWLSCYWVDPAYKAQNVAANLYRKILTEWEGNIFVTNFVPWLERVYQRSGYYKPTMNKKGFRAYMRLNLADILPPKQQFFAKLRPVLKGVDGLFNLFFDVRLFVNKLPQDFTFEYVSRFDDSMQPFIEKMREENWSKRGVEDLNWILDYPWMISGAMEDANSKRYYFSSLSKRFFHQLVKICDKKGKLKAILMLTVRDNDLSIPYVFCDDAYDEAARFMVYKMKELKLNMLTTYHAPLAEALEKHTSRFLFSKDMNKPFIIAKTKDYINELHFQDGDGDCVFY